MSKAFRFLILTAALVPAGSMAQTEVYLTETPDYRWYAGCFGTATGNLAGYWDRHGFPAFYTGPTAGGVAPLHDVGDNVGIRSMWATKAGLDGRPADKPGHVDDYWVYYLSDGVFSYESTADDPYVTQGRAEHEPDCIGDFIGLNQKKWTNMNEECDGNIDAYSFVYWDKTGARRTNYTPPPQGETPVADIQSGMREWTRYRGYDADVFTQLVDFNPNVPMGQGFTFEDLKAEIDAGYPVMVFLQGYSANSRSLANPDPFPKANPAIHGMVVYGYYEDELGPLVRVRTSWGSGDFVYYEWNEVPWEGYGSDLVSVRGVIGFRPKPQITEIRRAGGELQLKWDGPLSELVRDGVPESAHQYVVERAASLDGEFMAVTEPISGREATAGDCCEGAAFYRIRLVAE